MASIRRSHSVGIALLLLFLACTGVAGAQPGARANGGPSPRLLDERIEPVQGWRDPGEGFLVWPEEGLAYFLHGNRAPGYSHVVAMDLTTGQVVATAALPSRGYRSWEAAVGGLRLFGDIDRAAGRLLLPVGAPSPIVGAQEGVTNTAERGEFCAFIDSVSISKSCVVGIQILDARSLASVGYVPLQPLRVNGHALSAHLLDMRFAPSRGPEDTAKLHLVVSEFVHHQPPSITTVHPDYRVPSNPRQVLQQNPTYVLQVDPYAGRHDWSVPIDACRGSRHAANHEVDGLQSVRPYEAAVFRSPSLADPAVYVGCHNGQALTGMVVKVPLDAAGNPVSPLPVRTPLGDAVHVPGNQRAVSGPDNVYEFIADPASHRILMRVLDGVFGPEAWWVFDGQAQQFVGTLQIGPSSILGGMAGLDAEHGRLYVLVPPLEDFPGGLFVANVRGTPLAPAKAFPEFANLGHAFQWVGRRLIVWPSTGTRLDNRIYVPEKVPTFSAYAVLRDRGGQP